jgi:membrane protein DedA with SNARE-associated domain
VIAHAARSVAIVRLLPRNFREKGEVVEFAAALDVVLAFILRHPRWIGLVALLLAFGGEMLPIVWGSLAGLGSIIAGSDPQLLIVIVPAAAIGSALGDGLLYSLGHRHRLGVQKIWPLRDHPRLLENGRALLDRWGLWAMLICRISWPLRTAIPIAAGLAQMNWVRFQAANFISASVFSAAMLVPGAYIWHWLVARFF